MPPRKKQSTAHPPAKAPKRAPRRPAKTRALALSDAVKREPVGRARLANPLAALEPLQRFVIDRQMALLGAAIAWSPAGMIIHQQAAFWDGFSGAAHKEPAKPKASRKLGKGSRANGR